MANAYTAKLYDGEPVTLKDFALTCARGMGVYVEYRDTPVGDEVPTHFTADTEFIETAIARITEETNALNQMTDEQVIQLLIEEHEKNVESKIRYEQEKLERLGNYTRMLREVEAWTPPTEKHVTFKKFMIDQLESAIKFDCDNPKSHEEIKELASQAKARKFTVDDVEKYRKKRLEDREWHISYYTDQRESQTKSADEKNQWIGALLDSLQDPDF